MSDKMTPITFKELLNQAIKEYKREKTIYYVPVSKERIKSPIEDKVYLYSITIKGNNGGVLAEREFVKSYWMEKN